VLPIRADYEEFESGVAMAVDDAANPAKVRGRRESLFEGTCAQAHGVDFAELRESFDGDPLAFLDEITGSTARSMFAGHRQRALGFTGAKSSIGTIDEVHFVRARRRRRRRRRRASGAHRAAPRGRIRIALCGWKSVRRDGR
jgi:uncharacterized DUF497 family protein